MKKRYYLIWGIVALMMFVGIFYSKNNKEVDVDAENIMSDEYTINTKRDLLVLMLSYPDEIKSISKNSEGLIFLHMNNNKSILYDDKQVKNYNQKIFKADIQDTLEDIYPLEDINEVREENRDPGRFRAYDFLNSVYGSSEGEVRKNLSNCSTMYGNLQFNKKNSAADMLTKSLNEAHELAKANPKIGGFVYPTCGTFNYRVVQDTGLLSPHSFAIAIDLNKNDNDYWKWVTKDKGSKRIAEYPKELVKTFENNGFVWGGKWAHFDILHFEYRPEIILKAKYFGDKDVTASSWWEGTPETEEVQNLIKLIDDTI